MSLPPQLNALMVTSAYPFSVDKIELRETHISWVVLAGEFAYKIKKPVNFGFLDFSSLERRQFYCYEELRLNRRFSESIYLDVVPISIVGGVARIENNSNAIEYAVKMRRFDERCRLDALFAEDGITSQMAEQLGDTIASFHQRADIASAEQVNFGSFEAITTPVRENFRHIREQSMQLSQVIPAEYLEYVDRIEKWTENELQSRRELFNRRKRNGFVRECHGDLHLQNIVLVGGNPTLFDCIEFNEEFRWIDVISEMAFLMMDLEKRGAGWLARRTLNRYLAATGDYHGVALLNFYCVYRSMVRAKVAALRLSQLVGEPSQQRVAITECGEYLQHAYQYVTRKSGHIWFSCGISGSGKTTFGTIFAERYGWLMVRSDVERKRLLGKRANESTESTLNAGAYTADVTSQVYAYLTECALAIVASGLSVLLDATYINKQYRKEVRDAAKKHGVPLTILYFHAKQTECEQRIEKRLAARKDASEADVSVMRAQLQRFDELDAQERSNVIDIDTTTFSPEQFFTLLDKKAGKA